VNGGRLAERRRAEARLDRCELCGGRVDDLHRHVVDVERHAMCCACRACAMLFSHDRGQGRFRTVPERVRASPAFTMTPATWAELGVPAPVGYFVRDAADRHWVCYPGSIGLIRADVSAAQWAAIAATTALAGALEPEVDALLVHRRAAAAFECFVLPVAAGYDVIRRLGVAGEP
jgi:hypothetical protein